jgi:hypothetical protein
MTGCADVAQICHAKHLAQPPPLAGDGVDCRAGHRRHFAGRWLCAVHLRGAGPGRGAHHRPPDPGQARPVCHATKTPLQHGLDDVAALRTQLLADPAVRQVLPKVEFSGLISNGDKSTVMMATGVEPDSEFAVKGPFLTMTAGTCWCPAARSAEVMLGEAWPAA